MMDSEFNAKEARTIACTRYEQIINEEYCKIIESIKNVCQKGEYECICFDPISAEVIEKLEDAGFIVNEHRYCTTRPFTKISWRKQDGEDNR